MPRQFVLVSLRVSTGPDVWSPRWGSHRTGSRCALSSPVPIFKTFVVDTKGTLADHQALRAQQRLTEVYGNTNIQFIIRVEDGVLIIPPNGKFMPEGTL
ncbi:hypothetical protein AB0B07_21775 [Streptomyces sioyaensis]|uniref:hypothetical protein n=1 Tax=Streptomyces sioyaensis TaxID=67364 RepID=UPI00340DFDB6